MHFDFNRIIYFELKLNFLLRFEKIRFLLCQSLDLYVVIVLYIEGLVQEHHREQIVFTFSYELRRF